MGAVAAALRGPGVHQASPLGAKNGTDTDLGNPSVGVTTSVDNNWVIDSVIHKTNSVFSAVRAGQASREIARNYMRMRDQSLLIESLGPPIITLTGGLQKRACTILASDGTPHLTRRSSLKPQHYRAISPIDHFGRSWSELGQE